MAGLDKIKSRILDEASQSAQQTTADAKNEAEKILNAAKEEAAKVSAAAAEKSKTELAACKDQIVSSIDLQKRTRVLAAKQELIGSFLEKAYSSLDSMGSAAYFDMLLKLLDKYAQPKEGAICFGTRDLGRLPQGYEAKIKEIAGKKGGSLSIRQQSIAIENGFVLDYNGIEENCTFSALFEEKRDELSDCIRGLLFA